jgi:hypothetical protein
VETAEAYSDDDAPTAEEIREAISKLGFNQRAVLVLREIEGLSYEEIAQTMGVSLSAVETLLFRARQAMREQLEAAEHDLGCDSVQRLISLQLDGKLSRSDRGLLRAHLRACAECARFARSQRARKRAMPGIIAVPLPAGLSGFFGGGAGIVTGKVAAIAASAALVGAGASALVETGVVELPGRSERQAATPVLVAGVDDAFSPSGAPVAPREFSIPALETGLAARAVSEGRGGGRGARGAAGGQGGAGAGATQVAAGGTSGAGGSSAGGSAGGSASGSGGGGGLGGTVLGVVGSATGGNPPGPVGGAVGPVDNAVGGATGAVGGAVGGVTGAVGGATGAVGGAVGGATGTVGGAVGGATGGATGGAGSKLPPPPVSLPVEPPSLPPVPPVPNPVPGGGPSLP